MSAVAEKQGSVGKGVAWSALNSAVVRMSQFLVGVLVARLVSPHEFGLFVVALTVYMIVFSISDIGVAAAIVRDREHSDEIAPTVAAISMTASLVLSLGMVAAAPYLASALGAPGATTAIRVIAMTVVLTGISATSAAQLTRDIRQKERFIADFSMVVVSSAVLIVMALGGAGVMALAWSRVAGQLTSSIIVVSVAPKWYWPRFDRHQARRLFRFGAPLAGSGFVWFSLENVDFMVVGRIMGAVNLGFYNLAYNISSWPVSIFRNVMNSISIPTLARVQGSRDKLLATLVASVAMLAAVSFPVSALCMGLAGPLVEGVYGSRWAPAAGVLAILVTFGSVRGIIALFCDLLIAVGKTRLLFSLQLVWLVTLVPAMIVGVRLDGIQGAGWAHLIVATCILIPVYLVVLQVRVDMPAARLVAALVPPLLAAVPTAVLAHFVASQIDNPWFALLAGGFAGLLTYLLLLGVWLIRLGRRLRVIYGKSGTTVEQSLDTAAPDEPLPTAPNGDSPAKQPLGQQGR